MLHSNICTHFYSDKREDFFFNNWVHFFKFHSLSFQLENNHICLFNICSHKSIFFSNFGINIFLIEKLIHVYCWYFISPVIYINIFLQNFPSTILQISTTWTTTCHLKSLNTKNTVTFANVYIFFCCNKNWQEKKRHIKYAFFRSQKKIWSGFSSSL